MWLLLVFLKVGVDPFAWVVAIGYGKFGVYFPVILGLERGDLAFALGQDCESRGLYAACSGNVESAMAGAEAGQGAGRVQTDKPVRLGTALCSIGKVLHLHTLA